MKRDIKGRVITLFTVAIVLLLIMGENAGRIIAKGEDASIFNQGALQESSKMVYDPVYHDGEHEIKPGSDQTDWSYVSFGSYPQSEVTDDALKTKIDNALSGGDVGDVIVEGTKYRKVKSADANYCGFWKDADGDDEPDEAFRYFKWEPIRWKVLGVEEANGKLLVCADSALDCQEYNETLASVTWEMSTMRSWLNGSSNGVVSYNDPDRSGFSANAFYDTAFTVAERGAILQTVVTNVDNPGTKTVGGADTTDKVFLLSCEEVTKQDYGFAIKLCQGSWSRGVKATSYANAMGVSRVESVDWDDKNVSWWLRSPGCDSKSAMLCDSEGEGDMDGDYVDGKTYGVVPALYLNLSSNIWKAVGEDNEEIKNPVYHKGDETEAIKSGTDSTDWSYVYFGSYPQSEVKDVVLKNKIDAVLSGSFTGDVMVEGARYRKVAPADANDSGYWSDGDGDGKPDEAFRYFKWEPLRWKVLDVEETNGKLFVCAESAVDCQEYNEISATVTWETSSMRSWLNGSANGATFYDDLDRNGFTANSFYDTAFTVVEQEAILKTTVRTADNPEYNTEGGVDTTDKIFLLSYDDVTNKTYGFASDYLLESSTRAMKATAYANAMGAYREESIDWGDGNTWWQLRSPGYYNSFRMVCNCNGDVSQHGGPVDFNGGGVVPALYLNISSDTWKVTENENGGLGKEDASRTQTGLVTSQPSAPGIQSNDEKNVLKPDKPNLTAKNSSKGTLTLKIKNSKADGYEIIYALNKKLTKGKKKKSSSKASIKLRKLKKGKTYYYKVRAFNKKADGTKVYGGWSKVGKIKIKK